MNAAELKRVIWRFDMAKLLYGRAIRYTGHGDYVKADRCHRASARLFMRSYIFLINQMNSHEICLLSTARAFPAKEKATAETVA